MNGDGYQILLSFLIGHDLSQKASIASKVRNFKYQESIVLKNKTSFLKQLYFLEIVVVLEIEGIPICLDSEALQTELLKSS